MDFTTLLKNRINLSHIPFSDRGSRIMFFRSQQPPVLGETTVNSFMIRLAERWEKQEAQLGSYRTRLPLIDNLSVIDLNGNVLPVEVTTYPHEVIFDSPAGRLRLCFADPESLFFALPAGTIGLCFEVVASHAITDRRGAVFHGVRNVAYTTNGRLLRNEIAALDETTLRVEVVVESEGDAGLLLNITPRLGFNRVMPNTAAVLHAAAARWHTWFEAAPLVDARFERQYYFAWWVMRAGLISPRYYMTREGMTPSKISYVGVWQWDACFHSLAYRYVDHRLAEDQIRLVLDHQRADGLIPDAIHDEGIVTFLDAPIPAEVTKPPIIAWTAWKLFEMSHNTEFLDEIYEPLVRWNHWWFAKNDYNGDGLCEYNHPNSSGLDDSPLWDGGMPVESPDLNTYLCLQMDALSAIAKQIGLTNDAEMWRVRADEVARRMIEKMWDEDAGVFWAWRGGKPIRILTPFNLYPFWTGRTPASVTERLIAHLANPKEFWTPYPIPSVAQTDPNYNPKQMWRGPTWININYLFIEGLARASYTELARQLRDRTLELVMRRDDSFEYYHPETGEPPAAAASIFGWTSALFIDLAIKASNDRVI
jgi:putative isomerase